MLEGQTVLLTGALGSLGRAQAETFVRAGAQLILLDRPGHEAAEAFTATLGARASYLGCDLSDLAAAETTVSALGGSRGGIDVLVNNAALIINKPFESFSIAEYEEQMRVNASAAFALTRAVAPGMKQKRRGAIVNFCSVTLNGRWDGYVPYVASKGAVLGLTKSLARELGGDRSQPPATAATTSKSLDQDGGRSDRAHPAGPSPVSPVRVFRCNLNLI